MDPKPHGKPILCLDFDGVIHSYKSGWQGVDQIPDPPVPGVFEWIANALHIFELHVYSSRSSEVAGRHAIISYISKHAGAMLANSLYYPTEKPRAFLTIDDRCVRFDGNWLDPQFDPNILREFMPWYRFQK
jgi:hypothetical protein